jgi:integrase
MDERVLLLKQLQEDEKARRRDLPDLLCFMLATGVQFGKALATVWSDVDFEAGTVRITSTLVRVEGEGAAAQGHQEPGGGADPTGERAEGAPRNEGKDTLAWITSHTFRKTAATILDEAALSARLVADQLDHGRPSMTQDVYLARLAVDSQAALAVEAAFRDTAAAGEKHGKSMTKEEGQQP